MLALVLAVGVWTATPVASASLAGNGYSALYSGESVFTNLPPNAAGQFSAIFFNDGVQTWTPGTVGLLICLPDKVTCNVPSLYASYASGWYSRTVYASVVNPVPPASNGFFVFSFMVPAGTPAGATATFNGEVGLIASGALLRPQGYYQANTVPLSAPTLTITPSSISLPTGSTYQFTASSPGTWTVSGGCGAVTTTGLFVATAMNSVAQPCTVVAVSGGSSASATVTVFGPAASLSCAATPATVAADGAATTVVTASLRDVNGNVVSNGTSPPITLSNITPNLATMSPTGPQTPSAGSASVTLTTMLAVGGTLQVSASAAGLTGCNVLIASIAPGAPAKSSAQFLTAPLAADGVSTSILRVDVLDTAGNRAVTDNSTMIAVTRSASSANICTVEGAGTAAHLVATGRTDFTIAATMTAGPCQLDVAANNTSIAGTSATLVTRAVGAAAKLAVSSSDSPHGAAADGVLTVTIDVLDQQGLRLTGSSVSIALGIDAATCSGASAGSVTAAGGTSVSAFQGRATFTLRSNGAYGGCVVSFSSTALTPAAATVVFTPGAADHPSCEIAPAALLNDGLTTAIVTVRIRDANNNVVTTGSPYSMALTRTNGSATIITTGSPQLTVNGAVAFGLRSTVTPGLDTFTASVWAGSQPTLPTSTTPQVCSVSVRSTVP